MKKSIVMLSLGAFVLFFSCGQAEKKNVPLTESQGKDIIANYDKEFKAGQNKRDRNALERLIGDKFMLITPEGKTVRKKPMIDFDLMAGQPVFEEFDRTIDNYFVSDSMIVTTGHFENKGTLNGKDISGKYRNLNVYQKTNGNWQMIISQLTKIEPEKELMQNDHTSN